QTVIGSAHGELDVSRPHPGWSEQDPAHWIDACRTAIDGLRTAHPKEFSAIAGIGLSGQMHGATLLDERDQVLRPCILWNDTRSYREAAALDADPAFRAITG
ncbi:xylulokinase, partial [Jeotgalicoccus huakuii]|nr:xylulokinase [Jeotgalicoccus huakuii]